MAATLPGRGARPVPAMTDSEKLAAVHLIEDILGRTSENKKAQYMFREIVSRPEGVRAAVLAKKLKVQPRSVGYLASMIRTAATEAEVDPAYAIDSSTVTVVYRSKLHIGSAPETSDLVRVRDAITTVGARLTFDAIAKAGPEGIAAVDLPCGFEGAGVGPTISAILQAADRAGIDRAQVIVRESIHGRMVFRTDLPPPIEVASPKKKAPMTLKESKVLAVLLRRPQPVVRIATNAAMGVLSTSQAAKGLVAKGLARMVGSNYCRA